MELESLLRSRFGVPSFRALQKEICTNVISGRDTLALLSTGAGKSLCYQLPAVALTGSTIVISPLISLMEDQVAHLQELGISATWITHLLPPDETSYRLELITISQYQLIYVSPERLQDLSFRAKLSCIDISLVVIDEAHCISEWGHEFRPEYRMIRAFIAGLKRRPIVAAFTATATVRVARDILAMTGLENPIVFRSSIVRDNLCLSVIHCRKQQEKWLHLLRILTCHRGQNGIVYTTTRAAAASLTATLRRLATRSQRYRWLRVGCYHAGLEPGERRIAQMRFQNGADNVLCATTAFGMGVDKKDVRFVIHYDLPATIESYYQQVGRGGRDGLPASGYVLHHPQDISVHEEMINSLSNSRLRHNSRERLRQLNSFCASNSCRMQLIAQYFNEEAPACGGCDRCRTRMRQVVRPPLTASPTSLSELATIQTLADNPGITQVADRSRLSSTQLLTALHLLPVAAEEWRFIPGCGKGWRIDYEQNGRRHNITKINRGIPRN